MPAIPFVAAMTGAAAAVGTTVATAVGLGTVGTVAATAIGTGIISGVTTAVMGGDTSDILKSAIISGATSFVGNTVAPGVADAVTAATGSEIVGKIAGSVAATAATGGDEEDIIASGLLAGISAGISETEQGLRQEQFDSQMTESGLAGQTATSPSDFIQAPTVTEPTSIAEIINSLQPLNTDYSLSSPEAVPGLKPDVIETVQTPVVVENPTIIEIIDSLKPVEPDYSLGNSANADIVDGSGIKEPVVPNLESMGGGQGLVLPVDGGYITQEGFIPDSYTPSIGDPESFINQPAPEINYTLPEFTDVPPVDNSAELAALGVAKSVVPIAVAAIGNEAAQQPEEQTGFAIVPIPSDWTSPVYNQAFLASAPINFGSIELLKGTQWDRSHQPLSISALINTLNNEAINPAQPQVFGLDQPVGSINGMPMSINDIINNIGLQQPEAVNMNKTIGQLNNAPASLASIIAGIQSQYG